MSPTPRPPTPPHRVQQTRAYVVMGLGLLGMGFSGIFVCLAGAPGAVAGFFRMIVAVVLLALPFGRGLARTGPPAARRSSPSWPASSSPATSSSGTRAF